MTFEEGCHFQICNIDQMHSTFKLSRPTPARSAWCNKHHRWALVSAVSLESVCWVLGSGASNRATLLRLSSLMLLFLPFQIISSLTHPSRMWKAHARHFPVKGETTADMLRAFHLTFRWAWHAAHGFWWRHLLQAEPDGPLCLNRRLSRPNWRRR